MKAQISIEPKNVNKESLRSVMPHGEAGEANRRIESTIEQWMMQIRCQCLQGWTVGQVNGTARRTVLCLNAMYSRHRLISFRFFAPG